MGATASVLILVGAQATYSAYTDSGSSQITAQSGTLSMGVTTNEILYGLSVIFNSKPIIPGQPTSENFTVTNKGTVPLTYSIYVSEYKPDPNVFSDSLIITATVNNTQTYKGPVSNLSTSLRTIPVGNSEIVTITYLWPGDVSPVEAQQYSDSRNFIIQASS